MGFTYSAKGATATASTLPAGWPSTWPTPGLDPAGAPPPWPPGWPLPGGGAAYQVAVVAPALIPVGQVFTLEATTQTLAAANTAGLLNHLIQVTATVAGVAVQIKKTGGAYGNSVRFQVTNYAGSKYGFLDAGMMLNIDFTSQAAAVVFTVSVISVNPNLTGTGNSTVDSYNLLADASTSFQVAQPLSLTVYGRSSAGNDVSPLNAYSITVTAMIGASAVPIKKQAGDSFASSITYTVTNYTGAHYGFTTSTLYLDAPPSQDGSTATISCVVASVAPVISGSDTTLEDGCCDSWCGECPSCSGSYTFDVTLTTVPLTSGSGEVSMGISTRTIKACRNCSGSNIVDATNGHFRFRVVNNTGRCIHFQAYYTPSGAVRGKYNCESGGYDYSAGHGGWFYFCISSGGTATACMDHVVLTCGNTVTLSNFTYDYWCVDSLSPGGEGCAVSCVAGPAC